MAITKYNLKNWYRMIIRKSILHVSQAEGKSYSTNKIEGYYNDLTEKVTRGKKLNIGEIPLIETEKNKNVVFPIAIFQFGLGAYDLYLQSKKQYYKELFLNMVEWAISNQSLDGSWNNFHFIYPKSPFSAMAQGQGASLLIRAFVLTNEETYLKKAIKAVDFMLLPINKGGTSLYINDNLYLKEFTNKEVVLNGWIFAIFGLYDVCQISKDPKYLQSLNKTIQTLINEIDKFDAGYWSYYNLDSSILCSRFYHKLHIAQLIVLFDIFNVKEFKQITRKWIKYDSKKFNRLKAFIKKGWQKILE